MNENTKLILAFAAGVIVGLLAATSSLFDEEENSPPAEAVEQQAMGADDESTGAAADEIHGATPSVESGPDEPEPAAETTETGAEPTPETTGAPLIPAGEDDERVSDAVSPTPLPAEPEQRVFCMQVEDSGECRCYEAETMVPTDVSPEECAAILAEGD